MIFFWILIFIASMIYIVYKSIFGKEEDYWENKGNNRED
jgi:hypothetical protein